MKNQNLYSEDITSQPEMLEVMLGQFSINELIPIRDMLQKGGFDRVVMTGMGASLCSSYPASLLLANAGIPTIWIDNAELLHYAPGLITQHTLLWVISQSGQSIEAVRLLEDGRTVKPKILMSITNDSNSQLAKASQVILPIATTVEATVSTRTYLNSLAISQLAALYLTGKDIQLAIEELYQASQSIRTYIQTLDELILKLIHLVGVPQHLIILGRGPSMAAARYGALVLEEASKQPAFAQSAAEFRHGPMEMLNPDIKVLMLAGSSETSGLNRRMLDEIIQHGASGCWVSSMADNVLPSLPMPTGTGIALPLVETVPFQVLTLAVAHQKGLEAGKFLYSGKVTTQE
jgi:glutamine---fructose-6-phosphate transaminase (isomerizing)